MEMRFPATNRQNVVVVIRIVLRLLEVHLLNGLQPFPILLLPLLPLRLHPHLLHGVRSVDGLDDDIPLGLRLHLHVGKRVPPLLPPVHSSPLHCAPARAPPPAVFDRPKNPLFLSINNETPTESVRDHAAATGVPATLPAGIPPVVCR